MKKLDLRLMRTITKHKGQFIATMLVIAVGIMTFMTFRMDEINLRNSLSVYYDEANFADIFVEMNSVPQSAINKLKTLDGIKMAEGRLVFDVPLKVDDEDENVRVRIISLSKEEEHVNDVYFYSGNSFKDLNRDAYVIRTFAEARNMKPGDVVHPQILGEDHALTVRAVVASPEFVYVLENEQSLIQLPDKFGVLYVSEEFAMNSFGMKGMYNTVIIRGEEGYSQENLKNIVENALEKYGIRRIYKGDNQLSNRIVQEEIDQREISSRTMPMIFLLVAAVIMVEMMRRNVRNDRVSIGIMKSMGYNNFQIMMHYAKYCMLIGVAGGLIGAGLGTVFGAALSEYEVTVYFNIPSMRGRIYIIYFIYSIVGASLLSVLAGLVGAREVINIHPAIAMRPPQPKTGKRIWMEKFKIWKYVSFSEKIVVRNILRNKKRFMFIVAGIALTYGITMVPMFMSNMFDVMFTEHYGDFLRYDYSVNFRVPLNESVVRDIKGLTDVQGIEGKIEFPFEFEKGWRKKDVTIIGIDHRTDMIRFTGTDGQTIKLNDNGMYITETLATLLDLHVGDKVKINNFIPGKDDQNIVVKGIVKQSLGMNAYMDLSYMQERFLDKQLISGVYIKSDKAIEKDLENIKNISSVQSIKDLKGIFEEFLGLMMASVGTMLLFAGIMGFAIVYNTTIISILERRLEFSSMRIMGFSKNEIFFITLRENIIMTLLGVLLGIPFGRILLEGMSNAFSSELYKMEAVVPAKAYVLTGVMVLIYVLAAQVATYSRLKRLDFIEALKNRMT